MAKNLINSLYVRTVLFVCGAVVLFGFVLPFLVSAAATELVLFGFFVAVVGGFILCKLANSILKDVLAVIQKGE